MKNSPYDDSFVFLLSLIGGAYQTLTKRVLGNLRIFSDIVNDMTFSRGTSRMRCFVDMISWGFALAEIYW